MRIAAGVCVVAAGLLLGSGALAVAEPDATSSTGPSQAAEGTGAASGAQGGATQSLLHNELKTDVPDPTEPADHDDTTEQTPKATETTPSADDESKTSVGTKDESTGTDENENEGVGTETEAVTDTEVTGSQPGTGTSESTTSGSTESESTKVPPATTTTAGAGSGSSKPKPKPNPDPMAPVWKALQPVTKAVTNFAGILQQVPAALINLPTSQRPIRDAVATMQAMITSMAVDVVLPLGEVPGGLYDLLGVPETDAPPPLIGRSGSSSSFANARVPAEAPLFGPQTSPAPEPRAIATRPAASTPLFGRMTPQQPAPIAITTGLSRELTLSGTVPLTTGVSEAKPSLFQHVIEAVLVPASLTALAAVALPGVGGLLVVCAAGMRLGYRQAKAALALRASGIARFAGPGPLGVVRTGSRVMLRQRPRGPRSKLTGCPEARSARARESVA